MKGGNMTAVRRMRCLVCGFVLVGVLQGVWAGTNELLMDAYRPDVAFGGGRYLVVWQSGRIGKGDIRGGFTCVVDVVGVLVDMEGNVLTPKPFVVCSAPDVQSMVQVAYSPTGEGIFLVVWQDMRNGRDWDVYAARVTPEGRVLENDGFLVAGGPHNQAKPRVAWDGEKFLVVWQDFRNGGLYEVWGRRIEPEGKMGALERMAGGDGYHCHAPAVAGMGNGRAFLLHVAFGHPKMNYRSPIAEAWFIANGKVDGGPAWVLRRGGRGGVKEALDRGPHGKGHPIAVAFGKHSFLAVWKNDTPIGRGDGPKKNGCLFDEKGKRVKDFVFAGCTDKKIARVGRIVDPDVAWDGKSFVVTWYEYDRGRRGGCPHDVVYLQYVNPDGNKGTLVKVGGSLDSPLSEPAVASDGRGRVLVVYERHPRDGRNPIRIGCRLVGKGKVGGEILLPVEVRRPGDAGRGKRDEKGNGSRRFSIPVWHPDVRWKIERFAGCDAWGHLEGPRREVETFVAGGGTLFAGRGAGYWRFYSYDYKSDRIHAVAGSARGYLDGPFSRARFGGWDYVVRCRKTSTTDGRYVFLTDGYNGHVLRCLDLKEQVVTTVSRDMKGVRGVAGGGDGVYVVKGDELIWVGVDGNAKPVVKLELREKAGQWGYSLAFDEVNGRLYATMYRTRDYYIWYWDVKDGSFHGVLPTPRKSGKNRGRNVPGPFEGMNLYDQGNVFFGPDDHRKRFLYTGRVDTWNLFRLDLKRRMVAALDRKEDIVWFSERSGGRKRVPCYGGARFLKDGSFIGRSHSPDAAWLFRRVK